MIWCSSYCVCWVILSDFSMYSSLNAPMYLILLTISFSEFTIIDTFTINLLSVTGNYEQNQYILRILTLYKYDQNSKGNYMYFVLQTSLSIALPCGVNPALRLSLMWHLLMLMLAFCTVLFCEIVKSLLCALCHYAESDQALGKGYPTQCSDLIIRNGWWICKGSLKKLAEFCGTPPDFRRQKISEWQVRVPSYINSHPIFWLWENVLTAKNWHWWQSYRGKWDQSYKILVSKVSRSIWAILVNVMLWIHMFCDLSLVSVCSCDQIMAAENSSVLWIWLLILH